MNKAKSIVQLVDAHRKVEKDALHTLEVMVKRIMKSRQTGARSFVMCMGDWNFYDKHGKSMPSDKRAFKPVADLMVQVGYYITGFTDNPLRVDMVEGDSLIVRTEWQGEGNE